MAIGTIIFIIIVAIAYNHNSHTNCEDTSPKWEDLS